MTDSPGKFFTLQLPCSPWEALSTLNMSGAVILFTSPLLPSSLPAACTGSVWQGWVRCAVLQHAQQPWWLLFCNLSLQLLIPDGAPLHNWHNLYKQYKRKHSLSLLPQLKLRQMENKAGRDRDRLTAWHESTYELARYRCLFQRVPKGAGKGARSCNADSFPCSTLHLPIARLPDKETISALTLATLSLFSFCQIKHPAPGASQRTELIRSVSRINRRDPSYVSWLQDLPGSWQLISHSQNATHQALEIWLWRNQAKAKGPKIIRSGRDVIERMRLAVNRALQLSHWEMLINLKQVTHDEEWERLSSATQVAKLIGDWLEEQKYYHAKIDESPSRALCNKQDNSLHPCYKTSIYNYLWNSPAGLYCWYTAWPRSAGVPTGTGDARQTHQTEDILFQLCIHVLRVGVCILKCQAGLYSFPM